MNQILLISKSVKIHETLFSLPFAYFGCIYANNGIVDWSILFYVTAALGSARTFGMAINRYLDFNIDQKNAATSCSVRNASGLSRWSNSIAGESDKLAFGFFTVLSSFSSSFSKKTSKFLLLGKSI